uniref:Uncharacterized protein n=1 Tax=Strigamia maritima TaxID=126957 RepID=T1IM92_STRMM
MKGHKRVHRVTNYNAYTREDVVNFLNNGWQLGVAIGGVEESKISDSNYRVHLAYYTNFHKKYPRSILGSMVCKTACYEKYCDWGGMHNLHTGLSLIKILPKKWLFSIPCIGGLPVKLTSIIGKEIEYDASKPPEEIMEKLRNGMQSHIDKNQIIPGNKIRALRERFIDTSTEHYKNWGTHNSKPIIERKFDVQISNEDSWEELQNANQEINNLRQFEITQELYYDYMAHQSKEELITAKNHRI